MSYKLVNIGTFNINHNFWELNPQLIYMQPFRKLYERDKTKDKSLSSKEMWCIWLHEDPNYENKIYRQDSDVKLESIKYYYPDFDTKDEVIAECIKQYDTKLVTAAARAFKLEEQTLIQRAELCNTTPYRFDEVVGYDKTGRAQIIPGTVKDLEMMKKNTLSIYKQYEEVKRMFEEEQGDLRVHGGRKETLREKGQLIIDIED